MPLHRNKMVMFNATMLRNKREVLNSVEDYIEHYKSSLDDEECSQEKRKLIIEIGTKFLTELQKADIPQLVKPFYCYSYSLTHEGISLYRLIYDDISFNEEGELDSGSSVEDDIILSIPCEFLSVDEYAKLYQVSNVTVRQWIRRGKLRTARKNGREWLIPALTDPPKRGYEPATYHWEKCPEGVEAVISDFPIKGYAHFFQDDVDKKKYWVSLYGGEGQEKLVPLAIEAREQLELMLISSDDVRVELLDDNIMYVPSKRGFSVPYLHSEKECEKDELIFAECEGTWALDFSTISEPGDSHWDDPESYILPVRWIFYNAGTEQDTVDEAFEGDYTNCKKVGTLYGRLILCRELIQDGWDPEVFCDDENADLGYLMHGLKGKHGPLNVCNGGFDESVLYIYELDFAEELKWNALASRILQELPWLCKRHLHVFPEIVSYIRNKNISREQEKAVQTFYKENGFCEIDKTGILYAYTR